MKNPFQKCKAIALTLSVALALSCAATSKISGKDLSRLSLKAERDLVVIGRSVRISLSDDGSSRVMRIGRELPGAPVDLDNLSCQWQASIGTISGETSSVIYNAPPEPCDAKIIVKAKDGLGREYRASLRLPVRKQMIVFKADDLWCDPDGSLPEGWARYIKTVRDKKIKASIGVIGQNLEKCNSTFIQTLEDLHNSGEIEFWNHGYTHAEIFSASGPTKYEFGKTPASEQAEYMRKTQQLAKEKLGITFRTFGTPYNEVGPETLAAIEQIDDIKVWLFGLDTPKKCVLKFLVGMEGKGLYPDPQGFRSSYWPDEPYIVLQMHPMNWNDERYGFFDECIDFLKKMNVEFVTPSECARNLNALRGNP